MTYTLTIVYKKPPDGNGRKETQNFLTMQDFGRAYAKYDPRTNKAVERLIIGKGGG